MWIEMILPQKHVYLGERWPINFSRQEKLLFQVHYLIIHQVSFFLDVSTFGVAIWPGPSFWASCWIASCFRLHCICGRFIWGCSHCTGVSFSFCLLWLEPSFNLADTWIVIVCSSSWSVSSAASEYRHKLRQAQLHCRNETHTRISLPYFLCNLNKVVWEQDNMSSTIRFPSNQIEKRVARYVNFTHFARRTICQKRLLFNAWYYHHQYQPFAKSKSWEIFPNIQSQLSSLWTWD